MSNTSRRKHIKQGRMLIVAELYKRGWSISKIAAEVRSRMNTTCSTRTIWRDVQDLLDEWRSVRINDVDQRLQLELERIDGIGTKTVETLLRHFRSVEKVRAAKIEELTALVGPARAKKIRAYFEK